MNARLIYLIFILSGFAGLVYQVIWVRWFSSVFGSTVHSASLVIAVFMFGLGIGSYLAGRWIDSRYKRSAGYALRAYAYAEALIGVGAFFSILLIPSLKPLSAWASSYVQEQNGWYVLSVGSHVFKYAIAVFILTPITILMGATLTLLIRYLLSADLTLSGWRIGLLYGFNTAGAALGAFFSDYALIPALGLSKTLFLGICLNFAAAGAALRLAQSTPAGMDAALVKPDAGEDRPDGGISSPALFTAGAIALSGFSAMGMEVLWFRHLSIELGSYRSVFSLLLTVILVGIWLGSVAGGFCHRKFGRPALLYLLSQTCFIALAMFLFNALPLREAMVLPGKGWPEWAHNAMATWVLAKPIAALTGFPAFLMGFAYPLANANIQNAQSRVGRRAGLLYLANTVGAVGGSLLTGFVLIPAGTLKSSVTALAMVSIGSIVCLAFSFPRTSARSLAPFGISIGALIGCLLWWGFVPVDQFQKTGIPENDRILAISEGINELIVVTESGPPDPGRKLLTNGHWMSTTHRLAQRYMRAFAHVPLLQLDNPESALVICFGVGSTLHAASLHPTVSRLEAVDLSAHVLRHADYFSESNRNVLADPRVRVFVNDGRQHLRMQPERTYDLITLEPPPITFATVANLYSQEFYALCKSRLKTGGYMTQWLPAYQMQEDLVRAMVRAFIDVFPESVLLSGERHELILMGIQEGSIELKLDRVVANLDRRPAVKADMERIDLGTTTEIVGMFLGSMDSMRRATAGVPPVTDDFPIMEYAPVAWLCKRNRLPAELIDVSSLGRWCPSCFKEETGAVNRRLLYEYLNVFDGYYQSENFNNPSSCEKHPAIRLQASGLEELLDATTYPKVVFMVEERKDSPTP